MERKITNNDILLRIEERLRKIEFDVNIIKTELIMIKNNIDVIYVRTPLRTNGWFGEYKVYPDHS